MCWKRSCYEALSPCSKPGMPKTSSRYYFLAVGACCGITAWLIYGVVELCCTAILPRIVQTGYEYRAYDASFSALLLMLYAAFGASTGLATAVVIRPGVNTIHVLRATSTAALTGLLLLNLLISWTKWLFAPTILAVNLILVIAASLWSAGSSHRAKAYYPFATAWLPCTSYLLSLWLAESLGNGGTSRQRVGMYVALLMAGLWTLAWLMGKRPSNSTARVFPRRALIGVSALGIASCALTAALRPTAYSAAGTRPPATGRPNIILISLDTVRADHLSVYGYPRNTTPHLKEFASESTLFTRAVSSSDMTLPSHASMFTGLYPSQHGAHFSAEHRMGAPLDSRFVTLAERLHNKGFWTAGVVANGGYLSIAFGLNRGFAYWDQRLPSIKLAPVPEQYLRARIRNLAARFLPTSELDRVARSGAEINQAVFAALGKRPRDGRAFFLFINYMDAHVPYMPPAPYDTMFPGKDRRFTESRYIATYLDVIAHDHKISDHARDHLVSQYDGGIAYLDGQLASLFNRLKADGLYENSLIIVTADHGEALGERNCMDHGGMSLYEDQIHVPLLIKYPNSRESAVIAQPVTSVDILPTILGAAGLPVPKDIPGQGLRSPLAEDRQVISESFPGGRAYYTNITRFDRMYQSVISAALKYIVPSTGAPELYDIRQDPGESHNLYNPDNLQSRDMAEQLIAWNRTVRQHSHAPVKIDRETMERLRSLGYVGQ